MHACVLYKANIEDSHLLEPVGGIHANLERGQAHATLLYAPQMCETNPVMTSSSIRQDH